MEIATTAKAATGGGAVAIGGTAIGVGIVGREPNASLLVEAENFDTIYKTKFGNSGNNKNLFVDPDKNKEWWEYRYRNSKKANDNKKLMIIKS